MNVSSRVPWSAKALIALCLAASPAAAVPADSARDSSLREEHLRLNVDGTGASIAVSWFRPPGPGPFPWIVLSHGTSVSAQANRRLGRYVNPALFREWTARGYAVVVPVRRGYGDSGGDTPADGYGTCAAPDFARAGEAAALDLLTTVAWARRQPDLDSDRWLLVGQSSGGFASIYTASHQPKGLRAVLAFAPGRGGDPERRPGRPCASDRLGELFAAIAPRIQVPVLWFYASNDRYIGPDAQQLWFRRFRDGGGTGSLVVIPPFPHRLGHGVFPSPEGVSLWTAAVGEFLRSQPVGLAFERR